MAICIVFDARIFWLFLLSSASHLEVLYQRPALGQPKHPLKYHPCRACWLISGSSRPSEFPFYPQSPRVAYRHFPARRMTLLQLLLPLNHGHYISLSRGGETRKKGGERRNPIGSPSGKLKRLQATLSVRVIYIGNRLSNPSLPFPDPPVRYSSSLQTLRRLIRSYHHQKTLLIIFIIFRLSGLTSRDGV